MARTTARDRGAAWVCMEGPAANVQAVNHLACLHKHQHGHGEVRGPREESLERWCWGQSPAPCCCSLLRA